MFIFEREENRVQVGEGQREREGDTEPEAGSGLHPTRGSNPRTVRS